MLGIRIVRIAHGLTMDDLSRETGIAASRLSLLERGKIDATREELRRVADVLSWPAQQAHLLVHHVDPERLRVTLSGEQIGDECRPRT